MTVTEQVQTECAGEHAGCLPVAECRAELQRVLGSQAFHKAPRLLSLLRYIAEKTLSGELGELTEQQIGIFVFERKPGYNSSDDTIVRGSVRHLRSRLGQYYTEEGATNPIQISIPKGGYVAVFQAAALPAREVPAAPPNLRDLPRSEEDLQVRRHEVRAVWPWSAWLVVLLLVATVVSLSAVLWEKRSAVKSSAAIEGPASLWHVLFQPERHTIIVPGDAALDSYIAWENKSVSLADYSNQTYQQHVSVSKPPVGLDVPLSVRSVTPMADLRMTAELMRVADGLNASGVPAHTQIRYARDLTVNEMRDADLILIGAETFNPWVTLYQSQLDFQVRWDPAKDLYTVENHAPKTGEPPMLTYRRSEGGQALTVVAFVENSQGQGSVLLIEGTSMGTTYSALTFLTSERLWQPVLQQATDASGHLHHFEALLGNDFVRGGATNTRVLAVHVH